MAGKPKQAIASTLKLRIKVETPNCRSQTGLPTIASSAKIPTIEAQSRPPQWLAGGLVFGISINRLRSWQLSTPRLASKCQQGSELCGRADSNLAWSDHSWAAERSKRKRLRRI